MLWNQKLILKLHNQLQEKNSEILEKFDQDSMKCKSCRKEFPINSLRKHLGKKHSCKVKYTAEELKELDELCNSYRKEKLAAKYREKKLQNPVKVRKTNCAV